MCLPDVGKGLLPPLSLPSATTDFFLSFFSCSCSSLTPVFSPSFFSSTQKAIGLYAPHQRRTCSRRISHSVHRPETCTCKRSAEELSTGVGQRRLMPGHWRLNAAEKQEKIMCMFVKEEPQREKRVCERAKARRTAERKRDDKNGAAGESDNPISLPRNFSLHLCFSHTSSLLLGPPLFSLIPPNVVPQRLQGDRQDKGRHVGGGA